MDVKKFIRNILLEVELQTGQIVNLKNPNHLRVLESVLMRMGLSDVSDEVISRLVEANDDPKKDLTKSAREKIDSAGLEHLGWSFWGKDGKVMYRKDSETGDLVPAGQDDYEKVNQRQQKDAGNVPKANTATNNGNQPNEPEVGTAFSGKQGEEFRAQLPDGDPEKPKEDKKTPKKDDGNQFKQLSSQTLKTKQKQLESARQKIESGNHSEETKEAYNVFEQNMNKVLNAKTDQEQIEAIRTLADYGFLKRNGNGKKLYIDNLPLPSKQMTGQSGDSFGEMVNKIAEENAIDIPLRDESADKALADVSGKHNEAGVVALLHPTDENMNEYNKLKDSYESYGGDEKKAHQQNEKAVDAINQEIEKKFPGGKIKSAAQVGGIGPEKLKKLGINPKKDPTDVIVEIEMEDGTTRHMKLSMKVYADPNSITMKNSGMNDAGSHYLGEPEIDNELQSLREKYNYSEVGISAAEVATRKREFKSAYLTTFSQKMEQMSKTPEGQEKLLDMWKEVHGCGNDVYTSITNKQTGETIVHPPEYYCEPKIPLKVEYDGVKVVIRMGGENDNSFLELVCKTESQASPKLLFNHKSKKVK